MLITLGLGEDFGLISFGLGDTVGVEDVVSEVSHPSGIENIFDYTYIRNKPIPGEMTSIIYSRSIVYGMLLGINIGSEIKIETACQCSGKIEGQYDYKRHALIEDEEIMIMI